VTPAPSLHTAPAVNMCTYNDKTLSQNIANERKRVSQ
jgi:hypothetical protein